MSREAMKLALEALEKVITAFGPGLTLQQKAATALRQALETEKQWVGLTKEDMPDGDNPMFDTNEFYAGMSVWHGWVLREVLFDNGEPIGHREPEQEPVAWADAIIDDLQGLFDTDGITEQDSGDALIRLSDAIAAVEDERKRYTAPPKQEPVAWANSFDLQNFDMKVRTGPDLHHTVPLYTAPPKREWVGLTDEEICRIKAQINGTLDVQFVVFTRAIEAKLREKNT